MGNILAGHFGLVKDIAKDKIIKPTHVVRGALDKSTDFGSVFIVGRYPDGSLYLASSHNLVQVKELLQEALFEVEWRLKS